MADKIDAKEVELFLLDNLDFFEWVDDSRRLIEKRWRNKQKKIGEKSEEAR